MIWSREEGSENNHLRCCSLSCLVLTPAWKLQDPSFAFLLFFGIKQGLGQLSARGLSPATLAQGSIKEPRVFICTVFLMFHSRLIWNNFLGAQFLFSKLALYRLCFFRNYSTCFIPPPFWGDEISLFWIYCLHGFPMVKSLGGSSVVCYATLGWLGGPFEKGRQHKTLHSSCS